MQDTSRGVFFNMSVQFRTSATPTIEPAQSIVPTEEYIKNDVGAEENFEDIEPVTKSNVGEIVLSALGIDDDLSNIPSEDADNLEDVGRYLETIVSKKDLKPTKAVYERVLTDVIDELGIDKDTEPSVILDRIGGMTRAWRDLMFVRDAKERRSVFMRLARLGSSKAMDDFVLREMEAREVWQ